MFSSAWCAGLSLSVCLCLCPLSLSVCLSLSVSLSPCLREASVKSQTSTPLCTAQAKGGADPPSAYSRLLCKIPTPCFITSAPSADLSCCGLFDGISNPPRETCVVEKVPACRFLKHTIIHAHSRCLVPLPLKGSTGREPKLWAREGKGLQVRDARGRRLELKEFYTHVRQGRVS